MSADRLPIGVEGLGLGRQLGERTCDLGHLVDRRAGISAIQRPRHRSANASNSIGLYLAISDRNPTAVARSRGRRLSCDATLLGMSTSQLGAAQLGAMQLGSVGGRAVVATNPAE